MQTITTPPDTSNLVPCVFFSNENHAYIVTHNLSGAFAGWYWCIPGDKDPIGPFSTKKVALDDADRTLPRSDGAA